MNQDDQRKLAIECGAVMNNVITTYTLLDGSFAMSANELAAYTAAVEAPLQARIAQLEETLKECLVAFGNSSNGIVDHVYTVLSDNSSTWLSEHDKEVRRDQIKIDAGICEIQDGMHDALYAEAIIYQHK